MWNWLRELYLIRDERRASREVCKSCEVLKVQLERANYEREQLINHLLKPAAAVEEKKPIPVTQPLNVRHMPFRVKQQILEAESREEARIMRKHQENMKKAEENAVKDFKRAADVTNIQIDTSPQVEALELELGIK